jgi:hypothetical protein
MVGGDEMSEAGRKARFEQWEKYGATDSRATSRPIRIAESAASRCIDLAWEFVRMKETQAGPAAHPPPLSELVSPAGTELHRLVNAVTQPPDASPVAAGPSATPMSASAPKEKPGELFIFKPNSTTSASM